MQRADGLDRDTQHMSGVITRIIGSGGNHKCKEEEDSLKEEGLRLGVST